MPTEESLYRFSAEDGRQIIEVGGRRYRTLYIGGDFAPVYYISEITATGHVDCPWDSPTRVGYEPGTVAILAKPIDDSV